MKKFKLLSSIVGSIGVITPVILSVGCAGSVITPVFDVDEHIHNVKCSKIELNKSFSFSWDVDDTFITSIVNVYIGDSVCVEGDGLTINWANRTATVDGSHVNSNKISIYIVSYKVYDLNTFLNKYEQFYDAYENSTKCYDTTDIGENVGGSYFDPSIGTTASELSQIAFDSKSKMTTFGFIDDRSVVTTWDMYHPTKVQLKQDVETALAKQSTTATYLVEDDFVGVAVNQKISDDKKEIFAVQFDSNGYCIYQSWLSDDVECWVSLRLFIDPSHNR